MTTFSVRYHLETQQTLIYWRKPSIRKSKVDVASVVSTVATGSNDSEGKPTNIKATDRQALKRKSSASVPFYIGWDYFH